MARGWQGAVLRAMGARDHQVSVRGVERIAPHCLRIRFHGPTLLDAMEVGPGCWVRLWFPDPAGSAKEFQRGYTLAAWDRERGELDMEFILHQPVGPASAWAESAQEGDVLVAQALGSSVFQRDPAASRLVLIGDLAALPAINSILAELPEDDAVDLVLEDDHVDDAPLPVTAHPGLRLRRVARTGPDALAEALRDIELDGSQVWATPESRSLKALRQPLKRRGGMTKENTHLQAYWIEGRAMGRAREEAVAEG